MSKVIPIKTYPSRVEADVAKGFLEGEGIEAIVSGDDAGGMHPDILWGTGGARLMVREEDKEEALRLLEDEASRA